MIRNTVVLASEQDPVRGEVSTLMVLLISRRVVHAETERQVAFPFEIHLLGDSDQVLLLETEDPPQFPHLPSRFGLLLGYLPLQGGDSPV